MKAELVPKDSAPPIPLSRDATVIGRHPSCEIVLDDPSLSKRHALFIKTDGLVWVRDLASTNGMRVNGQKVHWGALLPGDTIALGRLKFTMYLGPDDRLSPSELLAQREMPPPSVSGLAIPTASAPPTRVGAPHFHPHPNAQSPAAEFILDPDPVLETRNEPMSASSPAPAAAVAIPEAEFLFDSDEGLALDLDAKLGQSLNPKPKPQPQAATRSGDEDEDEVIFPMIIAEE